MSRAPGPDRITLYFLVTVALTGLVYVAFGLTPSSYGVVLDGLQALDSGPVAGSSRSIRSDEWALATPFFQATVRNRFQRINQTSFYREDLRNFDALPLEDWSLVFKPQMWAFFLVSPALAFSIYHALWMCAFLAGYQLLFRRLGAPAWMAIAAAFMLFFSGFTQFWWTTFGPLLSGLPWILLIVLSSVTWWKKALLCMWAFPAFVLSHVYPTLLLTLGWGAVILILAYRPSLLRSPRDLAALAAGVLVAVAVVYAYYGDLIPVMRNTVYPGHRVSPSGTTSPFAVLSQFLPFLNVRLTDYQQLTGENICEIGAVSSFLPLLTLCLIRYRSLRDRLPGRTTLLVLLAGFTAITLWQVAPVPAWIGRILMWNTGASARWLFISGLLLTLASLFIWSQNLISLSPLRVALFVIIGPIASLVCKIAWFIHKGDAAEAGLSATQGDIIICGLAILAGVAALYAPVAARAPILIAAVALMNIYAFGRFNPLQPSEPIFQIPDTSMVRDLKKEAAASPDGTLVDPRFFGATLNGLGFRSVAHVVMAPKLDLFRQYFPAMAPEQFNLVFNRFAHIHLTTKALPDSPSQDVIDVPMEVFLPVRNLRQLELAPARPGVCSHSAAGVIDQVSQHDDELTIQGWAPWSSETAEQGIRIYTRRSLRPGILATATRPDIAAQLRDYRFVKSGFKLQISSADGKPLRPGELVLVAFGTAQGEVCLPGT